MRQCNFLKGLLKYRLSPGSNMSDKDNRLIWLDLEMTGLNADSDHILEIATIVTDSHLNILAEGPVIAIYQSEALLKKMDAWNVKHHGQSGLIDRVRTSVVDETAAETATLEFLSPWVNPGKSPMCGNSICQDRRFLWNYMPKLENFFHYRNLDVSSIKILAQRWAPAVAAGLTKNTEHKALQDIRDSIDELKYYRQHFIKLGGE
jgi:oligoribonuclease